MALIDFKAICDALAERFDAGTIATPTGATAMRPAFGQMPESSPAVPMVYIEPISGSVTEKSSVWAHEMSVDAVFLISRRTGTTKRPEKERQLWLPFLLAATEQQMKLGIGAQVGYEVLKAMPAGWDWTLETVADDEFYAIRVHFTISVNETVSLA